MKNYLVVGNNNYWYGFIKCNPEDLLKQVNDIKENIDLGVYDKPDELIVYEVLNNPLTITL